MVRFKEWCPELEAALAEPFPSDRVSILRKTNKQGKVVAKIPYISWHFYVARLNELVGAGWSMGQPITMEVGGKLVIGLPVTILDVSRINFGDEDEGKDDYGTAATNAFAQGFKRTCALFGMGLYMYDKKGVIQALVNGDTPSAEEGTEPATDAQREKIRDLLARKIVNANQRTRIEKKLAGAFSHEDAALTINWLDKQFMKPVED